MRVQLTGSLRGYSNMVADYDNARSHLNTNLSGYIVANPPIVDSLPGNSADVYIVEAGSADEGIVRWSFGFDSCAAIDVGWNWAAVQANRANNFYGAPPHVHTIMQMVCVWPARFSRTAVNGENYRYQYLTLEHEQAHVLNLADAVDGDSSLMRSGVSMLEMNNGERDAIRNHY